MADSVINYSDLIGKDDTFDDIFANIDKLEKRLADLAKQRQKDLELINPNNEKALKQAVKDVENLTKASKQLETERKKAVVTRKKLADLSDEELIQREKLKIANRERIQVAKQQAILLNKESGEIEKLRAKLSLTTLEWKKLSKNELENTKKGKDLIKSKKQLTEKLKELEKATGDNRRNVGNYTDALKGLSGQFGIVGAGAASIASGFRAIKGIIPALVGGFKTLRGAIISTGIGALVVAFASLVTFLTRTQRGLDFVKRAFAGVTATIDVIIDRISKFGEAIGAAFSGDFSKAAKLFKESVSGVGDEIAKEASQAVQLEKDLQALEKREISLITVRAKKANQIAELERLAEENKNKDKKRAAEQLKEAIELQKSISDIEVSIAKERARIKSAQVAASESTNDDLREEAQLLADVENVEKQREDRIRGLTRKLNSLTKAQVKNTAAVKDNNKEQDRLDKLQISIDKNADLRIQAIQSIQSKIDKAEAETSKDSTERLLRLEEIKSKAINEQREKDFDKFIALLEKQEEQLIAFFGENSAEVIAFRAEAGQELLLVEAKNQELSELQLEESEARKLKIIQDSNKARIKEIDDTVKKAFKLVKDDNEKNEQLFRDSIKSIEGEQERVDKERADKAKERADRQKELLEGIADTAQKIGAAINAGFERQLDLASSLVEEQAEAVESQRQRAEQGLENTLAFEQQQLAEREAERIRAEKKAKQAAEFITLLNLVSSYAASGDTNALARGLVDFSLLKALETGLGFEEGGYTGDNGTKQISGVVHGQEFVVTADDVKRFGLAGKSGDEFGEAMSDYFYSPLQQNLYDSQSNNFKKGMTVSNSFASLENEVKEMRRAFQSMPQKDFDLVQMTDYFVEISKRVTQNRLTNVSKQRKRL